MRTKKKMTEISEIKDAEKSMFRPNYGRFLFLRPYYIISINDKNVRNEHALKILNGFFCVELMRMRLEIIVYLVSFLLYY